jgi:mevalonate kinase
MTRSRPMKVVFSSAPGKIILFGEHAVNRGKAAVAAAVDRRVYCRVELDTREGYLLISGEKREEDACSTLGEFKREIDRLRADKDYDGIRDRARDFFAPTRYVLAHLYEHHPFGGIEIEWHSQLPMGAGLGSGAATYTSLVFAFFRANGMQVDPKEIADTAYQGDIIAHGGIASSQKTLTSP